MFLLMFGFLIEKSTFLDTLDKQHHKSEIFVVGMGDVRFGFKLVAFLQGSRISPFSIRPSFVNGVGALRMKKKFFRIK